MLFSKLKSQNIIYGRSEGMAKFWMAIAFVIIIIDVFLILTLLQMSSKLHVITQVLPVSPMQSNQLLQTEPFTKEASDKKLLDETLIRLYFDMRFSSFQDKEEMQYRWGRFGPVAQLSSSAVYSKFATNINEKIKLIANSSETTSVDILSISRMDNIFTVEFEVFKYNRGNVKSARKLAIVTIDYQKSRETYSRAYKNPFGLYVIKYEEP